ncbi:hypothetical protein EF910_00050 [Streptomyces sp. WAC07149]|uniref:hypothetical protein n=1 Tax=Streptomyces sp. WAC07149 TaxID=2487425 RepID=UPI000F7A25CA|nr:hypothetical protein [Streptomyces sp. WAC07149]RST08684.1 hypothetical protein EF910_00050 [Streptomyces sp. WAC07149]
MPTASRPFIASAATAIAAVTLALTGAPWWFTLAAFSCFALALVVKAVESVFPQESKHRLAWWRDRRRHQHLRRQAAVPRQPQHRGRRSAGGDTAPVPGPGGE